MSRIGKKLIALPDGVEIKYDRATGLITVKGSMGELTRKISDRIVVQIDVENKTVSVERVDDSKISRELHGLTRTLISNMIIGVSEGFKKVLEINGVGYRANKTGDRLTLSLGYSHPVVFVDGNGISTSVDQNRIIVSGISKENVGQYAANIRDTRSPEPYKGKGIRYLGEKVKRKVGKTGKK